MAKPRIPGYLKHKASGQAVVCLGGKDHYLGTYDSPESREKYNRLIAEWLAAGRQEPTKPAPDLTVSEVLAAYLTFAESYYRKDGKPTRQVDRIHHASATVRLLYGSTPARAFGPMALQAVRQRWIEDDLSRKFINARTGCIKRAFRWAASQELVPSSVFHGLQAVDGLRRGRTVARERDPVLPASEISIAACRPHLSPILRDAMDFQLLTAARPGETLALRECDLDRGGPIWLYRPASHKTDHRNKSRLIFIGPRCQEILLRHLDVLCPRCGTQGRQGALGWRETLCGSCADTCSREGIAGPWPRTWPPATSRYLFSPQESIRLFRERQRAARRTPVQPSQADRSKTAPHKQPGERYGVPSYRRAVAAACQKAGCEHFWPHQLRHSAADRVEREFGPELARIVLGHATLDTTKIYLTDDIRRAVEAMRKIG